MGQIKRATSIHHHKNVLFRSKIKSKSPMDKRCVCLQGAPFHPFKLMWIILFIFSTSRFVFLKHTNYDPEFFLLNQTQAQLGKDHITYIQSIAPERRDKRHEQKLQLFSSAPTKQQNHQSNHDHITHYSCSILNKTIILPIVPQFIIVGTQKAGTTALSEFLREHPQIAGSSTREPHFFDWNYPSPRGKKEQWLRERNLPTDLSASDFQCAVRQSYVQHFNISTNSINKAMHKDDDDGDISLDDRQKAIHSKLHFEKTPGYLFLSEVPERIASITNAKIIAVLRNPMDRALSHFKMKIQTHGKSFEDIIYEEVQSLRDLGLSYAPFPNETYKDGDPRFAVPQWDKVKMDKLHWAHYRKIHNCNYIQRGMYGPQLQRWLKYFPTIDPNTKDLQKAKLLVLNFEEFQETPEAVYAKILQFVNARPFTPPNGFSRMHNYHPDRSEQMLPSTRRYLAQFFRPYNEMLVDMLGEEWREIWES